MDIDKLLRDNCEIIFALHAESADTSNKKKRPRSAVENADVRRQHFLSVLMENIRGAAEGLEALSPLEVTTMLSSSGSSYPSPSVRWCDIE